MAIPKSFQGKKWRGLPLPAVYIAAPSGGSYLSTNQGWNCLTSQIWTYWASQSHAGQGERYLVAVCFGRPRHVTGNSTLLSWDHLVSWFPTPQVITFMEDSRCIHCNGSGSHFKPVSLLVYESRNNPLVNRTLRSLEMYLNAATPSFKDPVSAVST